MLQTEEILMKKLTVAVFASLATFIGAQNFAASPEQEPL